MPASTIRTVDGYFNIPLELCALPPGGGTLLNQGAVLDMRRSSQVFSCRRLSIVIALFLSATISNTLRGLRLSLKN